MQETITGTGVIDPKDVKVLEAWFAADPAREAETLHRLKEASRLSGMEVVYDLSMFEIEWSPVYWHEADHPVAWVNAAGERREGPDYPVGGGDGEKAA